MTPERAPITMNNRIQRCMEFMEWMKDSPFHAVKQYLLNRGFSEHEINEAAKAYVKG